MKKTNRKNKTNLVVKWPTSHFTIDELNKLNPDFINITLRVRLKNAFDGKQVVELGTKHIGKGRPKLVFAVAPVSDKTIRSARSEDIMLHSCYDAVAVASINGKTQTDDKTETVGKTESVKV